MPFHGHETAVTSVIEGNQPKNGHVQAENKVDPVPDREHNFKIATAQYVPAAMHGWHSPIGASNEPGSALDGIRRRQAPRRTGALEGGVTRLPYVAFILLAVVLSIDLGLTAPSLAEPLATHFDGAGNPNGWMSRNGYVVFMIAFGIGLPLLIAGLIRVAPAWFPKRLRIPNRAYWLAPERREETLQFLNAHVAWLSTTMVLFVIAIHHLVLMANASRPVRLPHMPFLVLMGSFLAVLAVWIGVLWYRFRREP